VFDLKNHAQHINQEHDFAEDSQIAVAV